MQIFSCWPCNISNTFDEQDIFTVFSKDILKVVVYVCSCACLYDPYLWTPTEPSVEGNPPPAQPFVSKYQSVGATSPPPNDSSNNGSKVVTDTPKVVSEVIHHLSPTNTSPSSQKNLSDISICINPINTKKTSQSSEGNPTVNLSSVIPVHICPAENESSSESDLSDEERESLRIRESDLEDTDVSADPTDPWHIL